MIARSRSASVRRALFALAIASLLAAGLVGCLQPSGGCEAHHDANVTVVVSPATSCLSIAAVADVDTVDHCGSSGTITNHCAEALVLEGVDNQGQSIAAGATATFAFDTFTDQSSVTIPAHLGSQAISIAISLAR